MKFDQDSQRFQEYVKYHYDSRKIGDIDPAYRVLKNYCDKQNLNLEDRFRLAFLYSTCYCAYTAMVLFNQFPTLKSATRESLEKFWNDNRDKLLFETDRRRIRSNNQFVGLVLNYKSLIAEPGQEYTYNTLRGADSSETYENVFNYFVKMKNSGRFTMFIMLELTELLTNFGMYPDKINLREALSTCNGLAYAIERDDLVIGRHDEKTLTHEDYEYLQECFDEVVNYIQENFPETNSTIWSIETTLCAYKKRKWGKRYVGYYLDRAEVEFNKVKSNYPYLDRDFIQTCN